MGHVTFFENKKFFSQTLPKFLSNHH